MRRIYRHCLCFSLAVCLLALLAYAQDSPSLGDVARQARQQKQQTKDAQAKTAQPAKASNVITNDQIPEHPDAGTEASTPIGENETNYSAAGGKLSAEQWKSQIQAQKNQIGSLRSAIDKLNESIQFTPANCVSGCVQWNERQLRKQQEVARLRSQLENQKKRLADMQEAARQQGYGSSVYEP